MTGNPDATKENTKVKRQNTVGEDVRDVTYSLRGAPPLTAKSFSQPVRKQLTGKLGGTGGLYRGRKPCHPLARLAKLHIAEGPCAWPRAM